jgi:uncharacterized DUF497 family protein
MSLVRAAGLNPKSGSGRLPTRTMRIDDFRWSDWNREHLAVHGVTPEEAEYIVDHAAPPYPEQIGDGKWRVRGQTATGRYLQIIFLFDPNGTVYIIHARGLNDREKRQLRRRRQ